MLQNSVRSDSFVYIGHTKQKIFFFNSHNAIKIHLKTIQCTQSRVGHKHEINLQSPERRMGILNLFEANASGVNEI